MLEQFWKRSSITNPISLEHPSTALNKNRSRGEHANIDWLRSALPLAELGFAIYFTYFVIFAIAHGQFLSVPFLLMFQGGFLYVCISSFSQSLVEN